MSEIGRLSFTNFAQMASTPGATGPSGPAGPAGPTGATGPAGGTGASGAGGGGGASSSNAGFAVFEEFLSIPPNNDATDGGTAAVYLGGELGVWATKDGSGSIQQDGAGYSGDSPGWLGLYTGSFSNSWAWCGTGNADSFGATVPIGSGEITFEARINNGNFASDGTNRYIYRVGLVNIADNDLSNDPAGFWFSLVDNVNSGKWVCNGDTGSGTPTTTNTTITGPSFGANAKLKIVVAAGGGSAEFFINGTSRGTVTLSLAGYGVGVVVGCWKQLGTSQRGISVDYISLAQTLTSAR